MQRKKQATMYERDIQDLQDILVWLRAQPVNAAWHRQQGGFMAAYLTDKGQPPRNDRPMSFSSAVSDAVDRAYHSSPKRGTEHMISRNTVIKAVRGAIQWRKDMEASTHVEKSIILPTKDNTGKSLIREHKQFQATLLDIAGGFSVNKQAGIWRGDDGKVYRDVSNKYTVLCNTRQASKIDALIPALCRDCKQECILVTTRSITARFVDSQILAQASA
jgi:hypothetical protein